MFEGDMLVFEQHKTGRKMKLPIPASLLEEENARLKRLVADLSLDKTMLQDVLRRKF
jgi:hypothetical protein